MRLYFIAGCIFAGIFVGFFGFCITRITILTQLSNLGKQIRLISSRKGDLTKKLVLHSDDVIGKTVEDFNRLLALLKETFAEVKCSVITFNEHSAALGVKVDSNGAMTAFTVRKNKSLCRRYRKHRSGTAVFL